MEKTRTVFQFFLLASLKPICRLIMDGSQKAQPIPAIDLS